MSLFALYESGQYAQAVVHADARPVLEAFVQTQLKAETNKNGGVVAGRDVYVGLAALNAFLQANVTGPVLDPGRTIAQTWAALEGGRPDGPALRKACLASLDVDGVSVYPHMQHVELFCLARWVFAERLTAAERVGGSDPAASSLPWTRLRIHTWHYKLLAEPNPGPGSVFNKVTQWSELPSLQERIQQCLEATEAEVLGADGAGSREAQVQFLVEKNNVYAMLGLDAKAQEALDAAARRSRFAYVLSGALGKRTRFQDKSTSQLVILARSGGREEEEEGEKEGEEREEKEGEEKEEEKEEKENGEERETDRTTVPQALPLNNDTLLENIDFGEATPTNSHGIPPSLQDLSPDKQPPLAPLDQIILLAVATLKDAFSPVDALTLEEILPYATRVLLDKATNWQIYSQALLVRSRIEMHRSRTVERGVLQMQAIVDQVVVDTGRETEADPETETETIPTIAIHDDSTATATATATATTFFPAASPSEQAPPQDRLRYLHALSTPPLWHLESELAFAWAGVGSLVSALAIFQRLRLWAEVALCLASSGSRAAADEDGRGAGGEEKARALLRWQLFEGGDDTDRDAMPDVDALRADDYSGAERSPGPANAPRLLCILGDIEAAPQHYERAWELSRHRYARAQRSLGEHYLRQRDWTRARDAYQLAVGANRLDTQLWSRLGDIQLRLGAFDRAAEAFSRAIGSANDVVGGEDARTWSNLGSALYSMYEGGDNDDDDKEKDEKEDGEDDDKEKNSQNSQSSQSSQSSRPPPHVLLAQALAAYKRGAALAHDNWRIWDNVVTLASRARPPAVADMVVALRNILRIRASETAVDVDVCRLLLHEAVLALPAPSAATPLARGTVAKAVCDLIEDVVVPLITVRSELWALVARERAWRGDRSGALDAAEKGWRAAMGGALGGSGRATLGVTASETTGANWLEDAEAWDGVVARTDELVTMLENYGPDVATVGSRWKGKARSALRSVMSKGREAWEGSPGWITLEGLLGGLQ